MVSNIPLLLFATTATLTLIHGVDAAKILCLFPTGSKSHVLGVQALMKNLAKRGHEVTVVSSFPLPKTPDNYRDIYVPIEGDFGPVMASFMKGESRNMLKMLPVILEASLMNANATLNSPNFLELVQKEQFDLVVIGYFMYEFIVGVGSLLNCPVIIYCSAGFNNLINFVGNPTEVSAVPHMMIGNRNPMTFFDRVINIIVYSVETAMSQYMRFKMQPYYDSNFPSEKGFPSYEEAKSQVSLVMVNSYFTQTVPRPYLPNVVEVGGLQIKSTPDPLPADIQAWLDSAEHGAIFLSFGSNLKSSTLRQDKFDAIIGAIGKLKQRVIWKWDTDEMPGKPANVMIGKWLPQDDILAHANLKLFVTHCGLGGLTESMYHGVPIVGIPMFGDQDNNAAQVVREGWGVSLSFDKLTEADLLSAIEEVLTNQKYRDTVKNMAILYRDRPQSGLDLATFWVEYVARHKGAPHLHYQGADLNFFQRYSLDVLLFIGAILYTTLKVACFIVRKLKRIICGGGQAKSKQKRN